jgi:hypothetical protein
LLATGSIALDEISGKIRSEKDAFVALNDGTPHIAIDMQPPKVLSQGGASGGQQSWPESEAETSAGCGLGMAPPAIGSMITERATRTAKMARSMRITAFVTREYPLRASEGQVTISRGPEEALEKSLP